MKYFYFWIFFVVIRAFHIGFQQYKKNRDVGYNKTHFEQTGQRIEFRGGVGETISCTLAASMGLLLSPFFLFVTTLFYFPAAVVLYFISR